MDNVNISVLGAFDIVVNDKSVMPCIGKTQKGSMLLRYLILHRDRAVSHAELHDILWPNEDRANPESALKTLVSRLRHTLNECNDGFGDSILTVHSTYQWNNGMPYTLDLAEFERLCGALKNAQELNPKTREMFQTVVSLYKGDLFASEEQETWVVSSSTYLHNLYEQTVCRYLELLKANREYEEIIAVSRVALEIDTFHEKLHLALMDALVETERINEALMQYKHAKNIHHRYLGVQPPKSILDFYTKIIREGQAHDMDINRFKEELHTYDTSRGAFVCEYAVFKEIYNLQRRSYERSQKPFYLVMLRIKSMDGRLMEPEKLDDCMEKLEAVLVECLRKGDVISLYNASQYALLLPLQSEAEANMVMERIKTKFYRNYRSLPVVIEYRLGLATEPEDEKNQE